MISHERGKRVPLSPVLTTTVWPFFKQLETYRIIFVFAVFVGNLSLKYQPMNHRCLLRCVMLYRL